MPDPDDVRRVAIIATAICSLLALGLMIATSTGTIRNMAAIERPEGGG